MICLHIRFHSNRGTEQKSENNIDIENQKKTRDESKSQTCSVCKMNVACLWQHSLFKRWQRWLYPFNTACQFLTPRRRNSHFFLYPIKYLCGKSTCKKYHHLVKELSITSSNATSLISPCTQPKPHYSLFRLLRNFSFSSSIDYMSKHIQVNYVEVLSHHSLINT